MKKIIFLTSFLLVLTSLQAQYRKVKVGLSFNPFLTIQASKGKYTSPKKLPVGFNYGLDVEWNFKENYTLATGLFHNLGKTNVHFIVPESAQQDAPNWYNGDTLMHHKYAFQQIELPISLKLKTNQIGYFTYFGQLGISNYIKISERSRFMRNDLNFEGKDAVEGERTTNLAPFNMGIMLGGGAEYALSQTTSVQFALLYKNALINHIRAGDFKQHWADDKFVNHMLVLKMGILF